ncbi:MAG: GHMP kinase, partial [Bacillota bacterium]
MKLVSIAPNRIDLAGGTLDIYPLYLFEEGGITVNAAIDVRSTVKLQTRADREIHLYSEDTRQELLASDVDSLPMDKQLSLVARIV